MDLTPPPELDALPVAAKWDPIDQEKMRADRAREMWTTVVRKLSVLGRVSDLDRDALILMCKTYGSLCVARMDIAIRGLIVLMPSKTGVYPQQNPACAIEKSCDDRLRRWFTLFGLVPAARQKLRPAEITLPKAEKKQGLNGFLARSREAIEASDTKAAATVARDARKPVKKAAKPVKKPAKKAARSPKKRGR